MYRATSHNPACDDYRIRAARTGRGAAVARAVTAGRAVASGLAICAVIVGAGMINWAQSSPQDVSTAQASISVDQVFGGGRAI